VNEVITIDPTTGWIANEWCPARQVAYFKPGTGPLQECMEHGPPDVQPEWPDSGPPDIGRQVDNLGRKIGKALGKIFKF